MLKVENLSASYRGSRILDEVSFSLKPHTFTAVLGKNGCGKSTLVSCINQQMHYTGKIFCKDQNLALAAPRERARAVAVLPQILANPHVTVEELVMFGRNPYLDFGKRPSAEDREAVSNAIGLVGIEKWKDKLADTLSGGERQKAYLAMILAQQTRLIVLDEPTTYLDTENETSFLELLTGLKKKQKKTLLVILHDLSQALHYADRILVLDDHHIAFDGTSEQCLESGILEEVFHVKTHVFWEEGERYTVFAAK